MDKLIVTLEETNRLLSQYFSSNALEIVTIVISGAALIFAIWTAHRQNAIALFEKRFSAYSNLLKLKSFSDMMKKDECSFQWKDLAASGKDPQSEMRRRCNDVLLNFQALFHSSEEKPDSNNVAGVTMFTVRSLELSIHTLPMLYSKQLPNSGSDSNKEITKIFECLALFMNAVIAPTVPVNDQYRTGFVSNVDAFFEKYADKFEAGIRL